MMLKVLPKNTEVILVSSLALLGTLLLAWRQMKPEIQIEATKTSPDGQWTAVVQMEVYSASAFVDDAVYAVRLKGPAQKDTLGDLVMNIPVDYPVPAPSADWSGRRLIITVPAGKKYQYLASSVDGVSVVLQQ